MLKWLRKALARVLIAVGVIAVLPAAVDASGTWTTGGSVFPGAMTGTADGRLTLVPAGSTLRTTCDVTLDLSLANPNATLSVTGATFANCVTNIPGCTVTASAAGGASTLPWLGSGDASTQVISISNVYYTKSYGAGCPSPLTGASYFMAGPLSPVLDTSSETINFDGTAGTGTLTSPIGTAYLDGVLDVTTPLPLGLV